MLRLSKGAYKRNLGNVKLGARITMIWIWLKVLTTWATAAILMASIWGKLVQWGERGSYERIRRSSVLRPSQVWGPHLPVKQRSSSAGHGRWHVEQVSQDVRSGP